MNSTTARAEQIFADALARPKHERAPFLDGACAELPAQILAVLAPHAGTVSMTWLRFFSYSFGMPHAPAAIRRRFIAGVTGTAPIDFSQRSRSGNVVASLFTSAGFRRTTLCLTRVVLVARFEMVDGMFQGYVEIEAGQPKFFAQVAASRKQILVSDSVRRVEARKNPVATLGEGHQPHEEGDDLALNRGKLHRDVTVFIDPDDERFVSHSSTRIQRVNQSHPIPRACRTEIRVLKSDQDRPARRRNGPAAP